MKKILLSVLLMATTLSCDKNDDAPSKIAAINFTGVVESCSDFSVRKFLNPEDFTTAVTIIGAGREKLNLSNEYSEFILPNDNLNITISEWDNSAFDTICNDVPFVPGVQIALFKAISGSIKIKIANVEQVGFETVYNITLELNTVVFENDEGDKKVINNLVIENVGVGWLPG